LKNLTFSKKSNPVQLLAELQQLPELAPIALSENELVAVFRLTSDEENVYLEVDDSVPGGAETKISAVVEQHTAIPQPIPPLPNWDAFFIQAYQSPVYLRITNQNQLARQRAITRLEILLGNRPSHRAQYDLLKRFWDEAVAGVVPAFTSTEISELNAIASNNSMPFQFDATGQMVLL